MPTFLSGPASRTPFRNQALAKALLSPSEKVSKYIDDACDWFGDVVPLPRCETSQKVGELPMTRAQLEQFFASEMPLFPFGVTNGAVASGAVGASGVTSGLGFTNTASVAGGSGLLCPLLVMGMQFFFDGELDVYSLAGVTEINAPGPTPGEDTPPQAGETRHQGVFEFGRHILRAKKYFLEAYSYRMTVGCKTVLMADRMRNIGFCESEEVEGCGTAMMCPHEDILRANIIAINNGFTKVFFPYLAVDEGTGDFALPTPVVPAQRIGLRNKGCLNGLRKLPYPFLITRDTIFSAEFIVEDSIGEYFRQRLIDTLTQEATPQPYAAGYTDPLVDTDGTLTLGPAATALTVPDYFGQGQNLVITAGQQIPADVLYLSAGPGGVFTVHVLQQITGVAPITGLAPGGAPITGTLAALSALGGSLALALGAITASATGAAIGQATVDVCKGGTFSFGVIFCGVDFTLQQCIDFGGSYGLGMPQVYWEAASVAMGQAGANLSTRGGYLAGAESPQDIISKIEAARRGAGHPPQLQGLAPLRLPAPRVRAGRVEPP